MLNYCWWRSVQQNCMKRDYCRMSKSSIFCWIPIPTDKTIDRIANDIDSSRSTCRFNVRRLYIKPLPCSIGYEKQCIKSSFIERRCESVFDNSRFRLGEHPHALLSKQARHADTWMKTADKSTKTSDSSSHELVRLLPRSATSSDWSLPPLSDKISYFRVRLEKRHSLMKCFYVSKLEDLLQKIDNTLNCVDDTIWPTLSLLQS